MLNFLMILTKLGKSEAKDLAVFSSSSANIILKPPIAASVLQAKSSYDSGLPISPVNQYSTNIPRIGKI